MRSVRIMDLDNVLNIECPNIELSKHNILAHKIEFRTSQKKPDHFANIKL